MALIMIGQQLSRQFFVAELTKTFLLVSCSADKVQNLLWLFTVEALFLKLVLEIFEM